MDIECSNCQEPWDLYHIMHEEGTVTAIENTPGEPDIIEHAGFKMYNFCGKDEMPEGHMIIQSCPACPRPKAKPGEPIPAPYEVVRDSDSDINEKDRFALLAKITA